MYSFLHYYILHSIFMNTIVAFHHSKNLWVVSILGRNDIRKFCRSAYSAMKYMFLLQSLSADLYISDNCLQRLSFEIALNRHAMARSIQLHVLEIARVYDMNRVLSIREP